MKNNGFYCGLKNLKLTHVRPVVSSSTEFSSFVISRSPLSSWPTNPDRNFLFFVSNKIKFLHFSLDMREREKSYDPSDDIPTFVCI